MSITELTENVNYSSTSWGTGVHSTSRLRAATSAIALWASYAWPMTPLTRSSRLEGFLSGRSCLYKDKLSKNPQTTSSNSFNESFCTRWWIRIGQSKERMFLSYTQWSIFAFQIANKSSKAFWSWYSVHSLSIVHKLSIANCKTGSMGCLCKDGLGWHHIPAEFWAISACRSCVMSMYNLWTWKKYMYNLCLYIYTF